MNAAILASFASIAASRRTLDVDFGELFRTFAPVLRVLVLLLYFIATFHKLNAGYFSTELSCAVRELSKLTGVFPAAADSVTLRRLAIYGSVAVEGAVFALLLVPRLRTAGLVLAALFHLALSLHVYHAFVSILFALFFLFTDDAFLSLAAGVLRGVRARLPPLPSWLAARRMATSWALGVVFVALAVTVAALDHRPAWRAAYVFGQRTLFFLYAPTLFAIFVATLVTRSERPAYDPASLRIARPVLWLFPLLVALNGSAPYLGLKTEGSFAMFSNLRTEGGETNHFLVRRALRLGGYDDLVTIVESPFEQLNRVQARGDAIPFFDLWLAASRAPDASVRYVRGGALRNVERVGDDPELSRPVPYVARKLVRFRSPKSPYGRCQH
jgi:hypothetical protein